MPQFGGYRTVRELSETGFAIVYTACRAGETADAFAVKVYRPSVRIGGAEGKGAERQARAFAESADIQRKAATEDPSCWAAIHAAAATETEAFYVTDLCRSSLERVIDGRLDMTAADLRNIVTSIVRGLVALKRACRRPHGNLKPGNVLIAGAGSLSQADIVLCDPLPSEYIDPDTHWTADLRELAEFIHQLVVHQPTPATKGWQIPESPEWNRLGKQAGAWRDLCNRLLSLDTQPDALTLEGLLEELNRLPVPRKRMSRGVLAAGASVAALIVGLLIARLACGPRTPPPAEQRRAWCQTIIWVVPLRNALLSNVELKADSHLQEIYERAVMLVYQPLHSHRTEVEHLGGDTRFIKLVKDYVVSGSAAPPSDEMADVNDILADVNEPMYDAIVALRTFFFSDVNAPKYKGWAWLRELRSTSSFKDLGCRDELEDLGRRIPSSEEQVRDPDAARRFAEAVQEALHVRCLWREVEEYRRRIDTEMEKAQREVNELKKEQGPQIETVRKTLADWNGVTAKIDEVKRQPSMERYRSVLQADVGFIEAELARIRREAEALREKPEEWYHETMKYAIADAAPVVNQEWGRRRANALSRKDSSGRTVAYDATHFRRWEKERDLSTFREIKGEVESTKRNLISLCERLHEMPAGINANDADSRAVWQEGRLRQVYDQKRLETLTAVIRAAEHLEIFPDPDRDPTCIRQIDEFISWGAGIRELNADYAQIEHILADFEGFGDLSDDVPGKGKSIGTLDQEWRTNTTVWDSRVESALSDVAGAAHLLRRIDTQNDPDAVIALPGEGPGEYRAAVLCAAWWRLRRFPNWPATLERWQKEKTVQQELAATLAGRAEELRRDFAVESARRHRRIIEAIIETEDHDDPTLRGFVRRPPPDGATAALETLEKFEQIAEDVAVFVMDPNWKNAYDMTAFHKEQDSNFPPDGTTPERMRAWLDTVEQDYRVIGDPRDRDGWTRKRSDLDELISKGLAETSDEEDRKPLHEDREALVSLGTKAEWFMSLPAITKYADKINDGWQRLWQTDVPALEEQIKSHIAPAYCRYLEVSGGAVLFKAGLGLDRFKPVAQPGFELLSLAGLRDFENKPSIRDGFFETTDIKADPTNAGWPKYIRAEQDESVILRFIPSDPAARTPPFYMALHEITNTQYVKFLNDVRAAADGGRGAWWVQDASRVVLVANSRRFRGEEPEQIVMAGTGFGVASSYEHYPAVRITCHGATAYAKWLAPHASVPTVQQHQFAAQSACHRQDNWHIRGPAWANDANNWNGVLKAAQAAQLIPDNKWPPVGADGLKYWNDSQSADATALERLPPLSTTDYFGHGSTDTCLPRPAGRDAALRVCDLMGNVWEWCTSRDGPVLCGGSCLSEPRNTTAEAGPLTVAENESHRDVGFRIVAVPSAYQARPVPLRGGDSSVIRR